jgi:hypothetical protein
MLLDFEPALTGIASKPFWAGTIRLAPGSRTCRTSSPPRGSLGSGGRLPTRRAAGPRNMAKFEATGQARARAGWEDRLVGAADEIVTACGGWLGTGIPP